jgi:hypothetical protein
MLTRMNMLSTMRADCIKILELGLGQDEHAEFVSSDLCDDLMVGRDRPTSPDRDALFSDIGLHTRCFIEKLRGASLVLADLHEDHACG